MLDRSILEDGVRADRTVEDPFQGVETDYCRLEGIAEDTRGFLIVIGDNSMTNVEIRIPFEILEQNGWKRLETT